MNRITKHSPSSQTMAMMGYALEGDAWQATSASNIVLYANAAEAFNPALRVLLSLSSNTGTRTFNLGKISVELVPKEYVAVYYTNADSEKILIEKRESRDNYVVRDLAISYNKDEYHVVVLDREDPTNPLISTYQIPPDGNHTYATSIVLQVGDSVSQVEVFDLERPEFPEILLRKLGGYDATTPEEELEALINDYTEELYAFAKGEFPQARLERAKPYLKGMAAALAAAHAYGIQQFYQTRRLHAEGPFLRALMRDAGVEAAPGESDLAARKRLFAKDLVITRENIEQLLTMVLPDGTEFTLRTWFDGGFLDHDDEVLGFYLDTTRLDVAGSFYVAIPTLANGWTEGIYLAILDAVTNAVPPSTNWVLIVED